MVGTKIVVYVCQVFIFIFTYRENKDDDFDENIVYQDKNRQWLFLKIVDYIQNYRQL